jgi:hypothetical protein
MKWVPGKYEQHLGRMDRRPLIKWRKTEDIPNTHWFKIIAQVLPEGQSRYNLPAGRYDFVIIDLRVYKNSATGLHSLVEAYTLKPVEICRVLAWYDPKTVSSF